MDIVESVRIGLSKTGQKELPPTLFYDELGSALFEAITHLPEYGLTRADERLLRRHAREIVATLDGTRRIAELGSGSGRKTRWLLEAFKGDRPLTYSPVDVSRSALERCRNELSALPKVTIAPVHDSYLEGLRKAVDVHDRSPALVLFLGGTIGNFERHEAAAFLAAVRAGLRPGDALLLGADLEQDPERLLPAYDDSIGVTAAFNLNVLVRLNRELGAAFDLQAFVHEARYDSAQRRIEMHLRSRREQTVEIRGAGLTACFHKGETIRTESSHKFELTELRAIASAAGFRPVREFVDDEWPFSENLWLAN